MVTINIGNFPKNSKTNLPQVAFWEVDKETNRFVRVVADITEWEDHAFRAVRDQQVFIYGSAYSLNEMYVASGMIKGFAYARDGEYARIYPLPRRSYFDPAQDLVERYKAISVEERSSLVYGKGVKELEAELKRYQGVLTGAIQDAASFLVERVAFAQSVLGSTPLLGNEPAPAAVQRAKAEAACDSPKNAKGDAKKNSKKDSQKASKKDRRPVELLSRKGKKDLKKKQDGWLS